MKHAIAELEIALQAAVTNEPVHRADGNAGQADLCAERAREFEDVISLLKAFDHLKDRGWFTPQPAPSKCPDCFGSGFEEIDHGHYPCPRGCKPAEEEPRTIRQWLETLPDGYRERALANLVDDGRGDREASDLANAIARAFHWYETPEGHEFWSIIRKGEDLPPLPEA